MLTHIWNFILKMKMAKPLNCKKVPQFAGLFFWIFFMLCEVRRLRRAGSGDFAERGSQETSQSGERVYKIYLERERIRAPTFITQTYDIFLNPPKNSCQNLI